MTLVGRLEGPEKLPTPLTGRVEASVSRQQVRLPSIESDLLT